MNALLEAEFAVLDKEIADARYAGQMHIETGVRAQKALSAEDSAALLTLLWLMPNNLYHETESEALTINNVGLLSLESGVFHAAAYVEHSPLRELTNRIAQETFGYMLREEVCPGGLEIGYFFTHADFDAVMLGPNMKHRCS